MLRQIALDTETTGINKYGPKHIGQRIIEIGAVEILNRKITGKIFHTYLYTDKYIEEEAYKIHKISNKFLLDKPKFNQISKKFIKFIKNSELIIHNAIFDVQFINQELKISKNKIKKIEKICKITDSLKIARKIFPGKRNNLDAICKRLHLKEIKKRNIHSALFDAKILAKIFLKMTSCQLSITFKNKNKSKIKNKRKIKKENLNVIYSNKEEIHSHRKIIKNIKKSYKKCFWSKK